MQSKTMHEPFVRVVKRGEMPMKKKVFVRLAAVALALVADALFIFFVTGLNPIDVYKAMIQGTFSTSMRFSWAMRDLASLLLIGIALAPAFKMRFWNTGAEGQVLMGALATAAVMVYYGGKLRMRCIRRCSSPAFWPVRCGASSRGSKHVSPQTKPSSR